GLPGANDHTRPRPGGDPPGLEYVLAADWPGGPGVSVSARVQPGAAPADQVGSAWLRAAGADAPFAGGAVPIHFVQSPGWIAGRSAMAGAVLWHAVVAAG